jgi:hypothetical protein
LHISMPFLPFWLLLSQTFLFYFHVFSAHLIPIFNLSTFPSSYIFAFYYSWFSFYVSLGDIDCFSAIIDGWLLFGIVNWVGSDVSDFTKTIISDSWMMFIEIQVLIGLELKLISLPRLKLVLLPDQNWSLYWRKSNNAFMWS